MSIACESDYATLIVILEYAEESLILKYLGVPLLIRELRVNGCKPSLIN